MALMEIVDEDDRVIGLEESEVVESSLETDKPMRRRSVSVFVITSQEKIVLQKRSNKLLIAPGLWESSASGHVDIGDSYQDSAVRELKEEIGIDVLRKDLIFLNKFNACKETSWNFYEFYVCRHNGPFTPNDEVDDLRILSISDIKEDLKHNGNLYTCAFKTNFEYYLRWLDENKENVP